MRLLAAVVLVCGCRGDSPTSDATLAVELPRVDEPARVMVIADAKPAALVWIGANGAFEVSPGGPKWNLGSKTKDRRAVDSGELRKAVLEAILETAGPAASEAADQILLLYPDSYDSARFKALADARVARANVWGRPQSGPLAAAVSKPLEKIGKTVPLVIALPSTPAVAVARALRITGGVLAVDHRGRLAALNFGFEVEEVAPPGTSPWIELLADDDGMHVVVQPDGPAKVIPWDGVTIDRAKLRAAYESANPNNHLRFYVLVREDSTTQTMVDILVALDELGAKRVSLAEGPRTLAQRRIQINEARSQQKVVLGLPNAQGDLDKSIIRAHVMQTLPKIRDCYEAGLALQPDLKGTVSAQFFITPNGTVAQASASGVDPAVANCVALVIKAIEFPKPKGGGGVQVNYPFTFRN